MSLANIPSPSDGVWHLGPLPLRAYALAIILGIVVAIWVGERRFVARGGRPGTVSDVAVWAIPFGLVGARVYHVATNPEFYFGDGKDPVQALYVWEGGLGIWGAIAFGALGAYLGCRFSGVRFTSYVDAVAPGIVLAQAIGRWGNYFNQELFGEPTDRPWGLEIDVENRPEPYLEFTTFHPTFLYESLWCLGVALVVVLADRRFRLGRGRVFALYVALYTAGRAWIEDLRIDDAHEFGPFRLNVWVSIAVFVLAVAYFVVVGRLRPGREGSVYREGQEPEVDEDKAEADEKADADADEDEKDESEKSEEKAGAEKKVAVGGATAAGATAAGDEKKAGEDESEKSEVEDDEEKSDEAKSGAEEAGTVVAAATDAAKPDEAAADDEEKAEATEASAGQEKADAEESVTADEAPTDDEAKVEAAEKDADEEKSDAEESVTADEAPTDDAAKVEAAEKDADEEKSDAEESATPESPDEQSTTSRETETSDESTETDGPTETGETAGEPSDAPDESAEKSAARPPE